MAFPSDRATAAAGQPAGEPPPAGPMVIVVNGASRELPAGATAADLVAVLGLAGRPLAVEHNEQVVPRSRLADCRLSSGDRLEIVTLVGGG
jgi:thiamine biosynthesis protein ThiS